MIYTIVIASWVLCGIIGYWLIRADARREGVWTVSNRLYCIIFCAILSPVLAFVGGIMALIHAITTGNKTPAKW